MLCKVNKILDLDFHKVSKSNLDQDALQHIAEELEAVKKIVYNGVSQSQKSVEQRSPKNKRFHGKFLSTFVL